jgi:hypothetical protein
LLPLVVLNGSPVNFLGKWGGGQGSRQQGQFARVPDFRVGEGFLGAEAVPGVRGNLAPYERDGQDNH